MTPWEIKGHEFVVCNCDYACPCQFGSTPTYGNCEAVNTLEIEQGHHGDVKLDGLRVMTILAFPGPVHEGKGRAQYVIDSRADEAQRAALLRIVSGQDSEPFKTHYNVFAAMTEETLDPIYAEIELQADIEERTARVSVDGIVDGSGEPIKEVATGQPHRVRIDLPNGFEFAIAEIGNGSVETSGKIALDIKDRYGQWARMHLSGEGTAHTRRAT